MPRAWLDEEFDDDPDTWIVGNAPAGLFARSLAACAKNNAKRASARDGFLPISWVHARVPGNRKDPDEEGQVAALVEAGWWELMPAGVTRMVHIERGDGFDVTVGPHKTDGIYVVRFLTRNPAVCELDAMSATKRAAGRKGALSKWAA